MKKTAILIGIFSLFIAGTVYAGFFDFLTGNFGGGTGTLNQLSQFKATTTPFNAITTNVYGKDIYSPTSNATTSSFSADTYCINNGSPDCITSWPSGAGGTGSVGTSTTPTIGHIPFWTTSGATPELLGSIATSTPTAGTGISYTGILGNLIGGTSGTLSVDLSPFSTSDLSEGTNLYYTDARVNSYLTGTSTLGTHVDAGSYVYPKNGDYHSAPYYVATSTTATSTFANIDVTQLLLGGDYITEFAGTGLTVTGGTLNSDLGTSVDLTNEVVDNFTDGSILFWGTTGVAEDSLYPLIWDDSNNRLGIGSSSPYAKLSITNITSNDSLRIEDDTTPDATPFIVDNQGRVSIRSGVSNQYALTVGGNIAFTNPGVGTASKFEFLKTSDQARLTVEETASDQTRYAFEMQDNPDTSVDRFVWHIADWKGDGGDWEPLRFSNLDVIMKASDITTYGDYTIDGPWYSGGTYPDSGQPNTVSEVKSGTLSMTADVSALDNAVDRILYNIVIDGTGTPNTFKWDDDDCSPTSCDFAEGSAIPITGGAQTLSFGVTITFDGTTGGALNDGYQFRVYKGGHVRASIASAAQADRPAFSFSGDIDTGMFRPATNALALSTNATERLRITSTGNVGIGNSAPASLLNVQGETSSQYFTATSTTATSTFPALSITGAVSMMGEVFSNFTTYVRSLFTGGSHITITNGSIAVNDDFLLNTGDTGTGAYIFSGASLEIPNAAAPTVDAAGEIALDTTDNQLLVADSGNTARVFGRAEQPLFSLTMASTSVDFISGGVIPIAKEMKNGRDITQFRCYVDGGTSVVVNVSDGTNDTETIACATTVTSDTDVATNSTFTANEKWELQIGTITGSPDYLVFEAYGYITRE